MTQPVVPEKNWLLRYAELLGGWVKRANIQQDAEDAVQDAALKMLEMGSVTPRNSTHYFHRIVMNQSVSIYRSEQVRQAQSVDDLAEEAVPTSASAQEHFEAGELMRTMQRALALLPESCQEAFRLRQIEGLSNIEIAQKMGVSLNMVERYMMRTIRHLQDHL
ncbi:sigma-70 family RNA polymerase sigma factor [Alcaligenaceae bacterium 429]|nr:sigma-70 family RNA polymerase sigma factor [Alcaligenaceae bacterium 429]